MVDVQPTWVLLLRGSPTVPVLSRSAGQVRATVLAEASRASVEDEVVISLGFAFTHGGGSFGDVPPAHDVVNEFRHAGLARGW